MIAQQKQNLNIKQCYVLLFSLFVYIIFLNVGCTDTIQKERGDFVYKVKTSCMDCEECVDPCPVNAIQVINRDDDFDPMFVVIDIEKCIGCGECMLVCPWESIEKVQISDDQ